MFFKAFLVSTLTLASSFTTLAAPTASTDRIVFSPHITFPRKDVVWKVGSTYRVTWDTAGIPDVLNGSTGFILLGHERYKNGSETLDLEHPLAKDFPIRLGEINVTVPRNVKPRRDYFIVLFGDSGNVSPKFRITKD